MPRFRIEHRLGVPAPASVVWEVLADLEGWAGWNPLYVRAEGTLGFGAPLRLTEHLEGRADQVIEPTVLEWTPESQILWRLSGRMIDRLRYIEIEKLTDEACVFSNGEDWSGFGLNFVNVPRRAIRAGFEAMGEAIKARALALWNERGGKPTSAEG